MNSLESTKHAARVDARVMPNHALHEERQQDMENTTLSTPSNQRSNLSDRVSDLSFPALCAVMDTYLAESEETKAGRVERWSFAIGLLGAAVGLLAGNLMGGTWGAWLASTGLVVELAGLGTSLVLQVKRELPQFSKPHTNFAKELERDFHRYQAIVQSLRTFPPALREQRQRYITDRRSTMHERLGLFTGGMERLGIMPVMLALYLQFKDWHWGNWSALADVTLVQGLLIWALLISYALSWHLIRLRNRVTAYERLLVEANRQDGLVS